VAERPGYVSPSGVGYDIGCGSKAALTDLRRDDLDALGGVDGVMGEITRRISFAVGVPAQERVDHPVVDRIRGADFAPQRKLAQLAESQLGTVGSGNHYVNLMADEDDRVWVGVHFGSRQAVRLPKPRLRPDHGWRALPGAPGCRCDEDVGGRQVKPGLVDWPAVQARLREQGIVLVGGGAARRRCVQAPAGRARRACRHDPREAPAAAARRRDGRSRRSRPLQGLRAA